MLYLISFVLMSCCCNVVFLEMLIREDPGCGNLVTFCQFLTISIEGFVFATDFGRKRSVVPLRKYILLVILFFSVSVSNNYALNFNISMPLHMIFKSGSLVANMLMAMLLLNRRYSLSKHISVLMVTIGIIIATLASHKIPENEDDLPTVPSEDSFTRFLAGILLLKFALIVSAFLGIYQEILFSKYGRHPREALFYSHALPLPGFLLLKDDLLIHMGIFSASEPISPVPYIPVLWLILFCNVLTQYVCVRSVFTLSTQYTSLTVTMVITLRKFISLVFSIWYFQNPFTLVHWIGTFLVFAGSLLFAEVPRSIYERVVKKNL